MLDVVVQVREPTPVAEVAERVDCDTETARDYLEWFASIGLVREHPGRPIRYELNPSYLRWRRIERIRTGKSEEEIVTELESTLAEERAYRERFDATHPDDVSLVSLADEEGVDVGETWEALSTWKTLRTRAELLDAARRDEPAVGGSRRRIDA